MKEECYNDDLAEGMCMEEDESDLWEMRRNQVT